MDHATLMGKAIGASAMEERSKGLLHHADPYTDPYLIRMVGRHDFYGGSVDDNE